MTELAEKLVPSEPGEFVGDIFYGNPERTTEGTHRWTGSEWVCLPTDAEALTALLAKSREEAELLRVSLRDTLDFLERHSNRWDGVNGKHPQVVVTAARAALSAARPSREGEMREALEASAAYEDQIKHMVNRFLSYPFPADINPDGGLSIRRVFNEGTPYEFKATPSGTNLLNAVQAEAMVRHMMAGLPDA